MINRYINALIVFALLVQLQGCGSGGQGLAGELVNSCPELDYGLEVTRLSGMLSYDFVPVVASDGEGYVQARLDFDAMQAMPARGITVEAINCNNVTLATTQTDEQGLYQFEIDVTRAVKVRARAQLQQTGSVSWNVAVRNNVSSGSSKPVYAYETQYFEVDVPNYQQDMHFASGWDGTSYSASRRAAPFAILDSIYTGMQVLTEQGIELQYPVLNIYWSPNNRSSIGNNIDQGELSSSFYYGGSIYLLGDAASDADEYDRHVVLHEWGHYIEHRFSRADNIGGSHYITGAFDPRVAFGEGFGNAWAAITASDSVYADAMGPETGTAGFGFDVEANAFPLQVASAGWFSELSVQSIFYDLYDGFEEQGDQVELGLPRLFSVLQEEQRNTEAFTTIFSFVDALKKRYPNLADSIDMLLQGQDIEPIVDPWGTGQNNWAGLSLEGPEKPVYQSVMTAVTETCFAGSTNAYNGLAKRRFFMLEGGGTTVIRLNVEANQEDSRPVIKIWQRGQLVAAEVADDSVVSLQKTLSGDQFVIELYDSRTDQAVQHPEDLCFTVTSNVF